MFYTATYLTPLTCRGRRGRRRMGRQGWQHHTADAGGDQAEVDDEKASRDIENATPVVDENTLRQVVRNEEALVRYDRMTQDARDGGDVQILRAVNAARQAVMQRAHGKGREDALIAEAMLKIRGQEDAQRAAQRDLTRRRKHEARAFADCRAAAAAELARVAEQRARLRLAAEAQQREQDALDAARSFDTEDFVGNAGRKNRWAAMQRVLLVSRSLAPVRLKGLARDWNKWDKCNAESKLLHPSPEAYALRYKNWVLRLLRHIHDGEPESVALWWDQQLRTQVPAADVEVPPLPCDLLSKAAYLLGEGPPAS